MMKRMMKKLKNQAGETISEVLIALLISALGMMMLAMMITSTGSGVTKSREAMEKYYSADSEGTTTGTVTVTVSNAADSAEYSYSVSSVSRTLGGKTVVSYSGVSSGSEGGTP
jgi:hypothetical protein